jgi:hypothetical protein
MVVSVFTGDKITTAAGIRKPPFTRVKGSGGFRIQADGIPQRAPFMDFLNPVCDRPFCAALRKKYFFLQGGV